MICLHKDCMKEVRYRVELRHNLVDEPAITWTCDEHLKKAKLIMLQDKNVHQAYRNALHWSTQSLDWSIDQLEVNVLDYSIPTSIRWVSTETLEELRASDLEDPLNRDFAQLAQYGRKP